MIINKLKLIVLFLVLSPLNCEAASLWKLNATFATLMYVDRFQTEVITSDRKLIEYNPWLKRHHTTKDLNLYFGLMTVGVVGISHMLPIKYGKILMEHACMLELITVTNNYLIGVRVNF